jgi:ribonuclease P protein component
MTYLSVSSEHPQLAFGLGRRFGNAVDRNRARRRLRAAFERAWRSLDGAAPTGVYLMTADRQVLSAGFDSLVGSVRSCLLKADQEGTAPPVRQPAPRHGPLSTVGTNGPA